MSGSRTVSCPTCKAPVEWGPQARFRPFCSQRCKLNDLGAWATEKYKVPVVEDPSDDAQLPQEDDKGGT